MQCLPYIFELHFSKDGPAHTFTHSSPTSQDDKVADSTGDSPPAPPSLGVPGLEPPPPLGPLQQQQQQQQLLLQQLYRQGLSLQAHPLRPGPVVGKLSVLVEWSG